MISCCRSSRASWTTSEPAFEELGARNVQLPAEPESVLDPKAVFEELLKSAGVRRPPTRFYPFFGERLSLARLRTLASFNAFERELEMAVRSLLHAAPARAR